MKKIMVVLMCFGFFLVPVYGEQTPLQKSTVTQKQKRLSNKIPVATQLSPIKKEATMLSDSDVQIFNLTVPPPGNNKYIMCTWKVRNNTDQTAATGKYKYYINKRKQGGSWEQAFSGFLAVAIGPHQMITKTSPVKLSAIDKEIRISIHEDNNSTKPMITHVIAPTTMPAISDIQIENIYTDVNNWQVTVRNNTQYYLWNISINTSVGSGSNWTPSGGSSLSTPVAPGGSGQAGLPRPTGWDTGHNQFRVLLYQAGAIIKQQVHPL